MNDRHPSRIVCLTEETTETLYLLGEERRIVGISGYTVRPARARREKPRVSAFLTARTQRILDLRPDLVIGFSDLQADISRDLVRAGLNVVIFNQRSVAEILSTIQIVAAIVGASDKGAALVRNLELGIDAVRERAARFARRPRVYFEEWNEPMICGIRWVSELIGIAGGIDVCADLATSPGASGRIVAESSDLVRRNPDIVIGSWCGKKFRPEHVAAREGFGAIGAVHDGELHEIKSSEILQPGPAALTDGLRRLHEIFVRWDARGNGC